MATNIHSRTTNNGHVVSNLQVHGNAHEHLLGAKKEGNVEVRRPAGAQLERREGLDFAQTLWFSCKYYRVVFGRSREAPTYVWL